MSVIDATLERPPMMARPSGPQGPIGFEPIYSQRIGLKIYPSGVYWSGSRPYHVRLKASWPVGKLAIYCDHLTVGSFMRTYRLDFIKIERIKPSMLFYVQIEHQCPDVPDVVLLNGWFLMKTLRNVVRANRLRLNLS